MDLTTTPDTDNDTPPHHTQQVKHFSTSSLYANGTVKKHHYPSSYHHHQVPFVDGHGVVVAGGINNNNNNIVYRECLKNHAASLGGHALDGCGEFMASSTTTTAGVDPTDPTTTSLKCAACGCHRNFHRREPDHQDQYFPSSTPQMMMIPHFLDFRHPPPPPPGRISSPSPSPSPPHLPQPTQSFAPQMLLALSSASDHHQQVATPVTPTAVMKSENLSGRKRFRTKFTQEQKEKMQSFSEKLGWKLQKCDDAMVKDFCNEIGVARGVLKVWMHNNKNTLGKRDGTGATITTTATATATATATTINGSSHNMNNDDNDNNASHYHDEETREAAVHLHTSTNGSSSSS